MNLFVFFGCLGGALYVADTIFSAIITVIKTCKKYNKYKHAYDELELKCREEEEKALLKPIGFKTEKEQKEIEAKLMNRK